MLLRQWKKVAMRMTRSGRVFFKSQTQLHGDILALITEAKSLQETNRQTSKVSRNCSTKHVRRGKQTLSKAETATTVAKATVMTVITNLVLKSRKRRRGRT